jgi:hypothetical protein
MLSSAAAALALLVLSATAQQQPPVAHKFMERDEQHNGGFTERLIPPAAGKKPHILWLLLDDYGWAELSVHRRPASPEVLTPNMEGLIHEGILFDRHYVYKYCSPTRSALQSGRHPIHVNPLNQDPQISNPSDPVSGFAGIPRNVTGIASKMAAAGYATHMAGKWYAPIVFSATQSVSVMFCETKIVRAGMLAWQRLTTRRMGAATSRSCSTSRTATTTGLTGSAAA